MATSASTSHYHGIHEMLKAARASTTEPVVAEVSASSSSGDSATVSSGGSSSGRSHEVSDPRGRVKPSNNKSTKSVSIKQAPSITSPPLGQKQQKKMAPATSATVPLTKRQKQFLKKRRVIYLFRARERRMIEKFRANACLNLARFQFPKQLPVLVQQQMEQQQQQQQINQESPNEDADSDGPQDKKPAAKKKTPPPPLPAGKRHRREASTMDTLVGVATAILDAQEQEHPNIEFK